MLLVTDTLPERFAEPLLRHNVRFVEQFLAMMRESATMRALAEMIGCSVDDLKRVARSVEVEHPDLTVPKSRGSEHGLGYGKKADWERFAG